MSNEMIRSVVMAFAESALKVAVLILRVRISAGVVQLG